MGKLVLISSVTVGLAEDNGAGDITSGHVVLFGGGVYNLVDGLHGKIHRHKLNNRLENLVTRPNR